MLILEIIVILGPFLVLLSKCCLVCIGGLIREHYISGRIMTLTAFCSRSKRDSYYGLSLRSLIRQAASSDVPYGFREPRAYEVLCLASVYPMDLLLVLSLGYCVQSGGVGRQSLSGSVAWLFGFYTSSLEPSLPALALASVGLSLCWIFLR